jgi:hypothetical protein
MRHFLSFLLLIPILVLSQVPQGVGYQGVATDAAGFELISQTISIRASVISGSATGNIEWQETHNTSTDTFGLFNLTIGHGTSTGNGSQTSFADITWGASTHFLKIEMDVNGGTNYSHMGTNQMMSVPYALYAENANINYDTILTYYDTILAYLSNDSTFITNISGVIGGGCDLKYPDGFGQMQSITTSFNNLNSYVVPANKKLYISKINAAFLYINSLYFDSPGAGGFIVCNAGDVITNSSNSTYFNLNGLLVNSNPSITAITTSFNNLNSYVVPANKKLYISKINAAFLYINSLYFDSPGAGGFIVCNAGDVITNSSNSTYFNLNGYLSDENYFADCGVGVGSSSSALDSTTIANMIAAAGGGSAANMKFPDGIDGEFITFLFNGDSIPVQNPIAYVVPMGKTLYVTNLNNYLNTNILVSTDNGDTAEIHRGTTNYGYVSPSSQLINPIILKEGQYITSINSIYSSAMHGFLIDKNVTPITWTAGTYTVPNGKKLYITNYFGEVQSNSGNLYIDSVRIISGSVWNPMSYPIGANANQIIDPGNGTFNGYLVDENYFTNSASGNNNSTNNPNLGTNNITTPSDLCINSKSSLLLNINPDSLYDIAIDNFANMYLLHSGSLEKYDSLFNIIWTIVSGAESIKIIDEKIYTSSLAFIERLDPNNGNVIWSNTIPTTYGNIYYTSNYSPHMGLDANDSVVSILRRVNTNSNSNFLNKLYNFNIVDGASLNSYFLGIGTPTTDFKIDDQYAYVSNCNNCGTNTPNSSIHSFPLYNGNPIGSNPPTVSPFQNFGSIQSSSAELSINFLFKDSSLYQFGHIFGQVNYGIDLVTINTNWYSPTSFDAYFENVNGNDRLFNGDDFEHAFNKNDGFVIFLNYKGINNRLILNGSYMLNSPAVYGSLAILDLDSNFNIQNITNIAPLANFRSKFHASPSGNKIISLDLSIGGGGSICVDNNEYDFTTLDRYQNVLILRF